MSSVQVANGEFIIPKTNEKCRDEETWENDPGNNWSRVRIETEENWHYSKDCSKETSQRWIDSREWTRQRRVDCFNILTHFIVSYPLAKIMYRTFPNRFNICPWGVVPWNLKVALTTVTSSCLCRSYQLWADSHLLKTHLNNILEALKVPVYWVATNRTFVHVVLNPIVAYIPI